MKSTFSLLCCLTLLFCAGSLHASTLRGADEYLVSPETYDGQIITLSVSYVHPLNSPNNQPDVVSYNATTRTFNNKFGGIITVNVPQSESERFASFYGLNPHGMNSHILSGKLLKNNNQWYVDFKSFGFFDKNKSLGLTGSAN